MFARDPDALLDMSELSLSDSVIKKLENDAVTKVCCQWLDRFGKLGAASQDDMCSEVVMREICCSSLPQTSFDLMMKEVTAARKTIQSRTAWRIDGTLREFAKFEPLNLWFDYPVHKVDTTGILRDVGDEENLPSFKKAALKRQKNNADKNEKNRIKFENAVNLCNAGEAPTSRQLAEYLDLDIRTVRNWVKRYGYEIEKNTNTVVKKQCNDE